MRLKVGVLLSGQGTNFQAIIDSPFHRKDYEVVLVVSNRAAAAGLDRAKRAGIPSVILPHQQYPSREAFEEVLIQTLEEAQVGLVVLAGFMRVLSKKFVTHFAGRVMNIHPALLPLFPGVGAIEQAWKAGVKQTGVTVHFIDEGVDTGPMILQQPVEIRNGESLESLTERIHEVEHQLYPEAIDLFAKGRIRLEGKGVRRL